MSDVSYLLWLIPALPLAAAVLTAFLGPKLLRAQSHWPCILGAAGACVVSVIVFCAVYTAPADKPVWVTSYYTVFHAGAVNVDFRLRADALTALMLVMVTFIGTLIAIYSIGYMHGELHGGHGHGGDDHGHGPATPNYGYPRFFAEVALFIFSMTMLVLGDNLFILYAGWEGVGLCSYLLIGFWFTKPSAADAARKAFLVTRIGDVGLFLGILLLWVGSGFHLDYQGVFANFPHDPILCHPGLSAVTVRGGRQVGPVPAARLAARRHGRPDAGQRPHPRGHDGDGRRLPRRPLHAAVRPGAGRPAGRRLHRLLHRPVRRPDRPDAERPQARAGLLHAQPARLHVSRPRLRHRLRRLRPGRSAAGRPRGDGRRFRRRCSTCSRTPSSRRCCSWRPAASCTPWATSSTCGASAACAS